MIKKLTPFLFVLVLCVANKCYAVQTGTTSTGVYYEKETKDPTRIVDYIPFDGFSLGSTWGTITGHTGEYVTNSAGGSAITDGWFDGRGWKGEKTWTIEMVVTTGTGSIRLVGRDGSKGTGTPLYAVATSTSCHLSLPIEESKDWYRIEYNVSAIGTDTLSSRLKLQDGVR